MSGYNTWTGPLDDNDEGQIPKKEENGLLHPDRWPYGPPEAHEDCCVLNLGSLFCDCQASASEDDTSVTIVDGRVIHHDQ